MANFKSVSMTSPADVDSQAIAKRRAMAEALQAQSMEPVQASSYQGIQTPVSWTKGLAKMLQAYTAKDDINKADAEAKALMGEQQARRGADMSVLVNALQGSKGGLVEDASGNLTQTQPQTSQEALAKAVPLMGPDMQGVGLQTLLGDRQVQGQREFQVSQAEEARRFREAEAQKAHERARDLVQMRADVGGDRPFYQPLQTPDGFMAFNARSGAVSPVMNNGRAVIPAQASPQLQGDIAAAKAGGKEGAEARVQSQLDLPRVIDNASNAVQLIDQMIGPDGPDGRGKPHPGFSSAVGMRVPGLGYIPGTDTANFNTLLDQVKGGAFLEAFNSLKGGGQITEIEGKKATDAVTRMQSAQSEREFIKAAREYQGIVRKGVERAQKKAGVAPTGAPVDNDPFGIRGKK